jgi:hypothetical protein
VDGIHFEEISRIDRIPYFPANQQGFKDWLAKSLELNCDDMISEYIRLTNIAFDADSKTPPVFLLDEIQVLCKDTTVKSNFKGNEVTAHHSYLSTSHAIVRSL